MIPLDAPQQICSSGLSAAKQLQAAHGGHTQALPGGGMSASVGDRPIPPPSAMRLMALHRQEQREEREELEEATKMEKEYNIREGENRTSHNLIPDASANATRRRRELAQVNLEARLCELAFRYEVHGCGLAEVNGTYEYSTASCNGAPVYTNRDGWNLHRDRPPVESTIGTDDVMIEFGWVISKDRKPWYGVRTNELVASSRGWQPFYGPRPEPSFVTHISWETHFLETCSPSKDAGNLAIQQGKLEEAQSHYNEGISRLDEYNDVVESSEKLQKLHIALRANRAEVALRLKQSRKALEDCEWVLKVDPCHLKAVVRHAKACKALGNWDDAVISLEKYLENAGPGDHQEVRVLLTEAEVVRKCERGESKLSTIYKLCVRTQAHADKQVEGQSYNKEELLETSADLHKSLSELFGDIGGDAESRRDINLLLKSTGFLDTLLHAASDDDAASWSVGLLGVCLWQHSNDEVVKKVLDQLPTIVPQLVTQPQGSLVLVSSLLSHRSRRNLKIADRIVETPGLLVGCLRSWAKMANDIRGDDGGEMKVADTFRELQAQCAKLDNIEALSLALFVECFLGEKKDGVAQGGFLLYHGATIRQMTVSLLRLWKEDQRVLMSLDPRLVGLAWKSVLQKVRREASIEVEKTIGKPGPDGKPARKLEWFKLKPVTSLRKDIGAFYVEDILPAFLDFLSAHLQATCCRGSEKVVEDGIVARSPPVEWTEEVLDKPFAWGVLLPLVVTTPAIASRAASLLELLIQKHPHNEILANQLARYQVFMPLLNMPWPPTQTARSHLRSTMELGPAVRRSLAVLLRCTLDTEMAMKVMKLQLETSISASVELVNNVIKDRDEPDSIAAALEVMGLIATNMDCWDQFPDSLVFDIVNEFIHNVHKPTRNHFAKVLRHIHVAQRAQEKLRCALCDERLGLNDGQRDRIFSEIFDTGTLAGHLQAKRMAEVHAKIEAKPADIADDDARRKHVDALTDLIYDELFKGKQSSRVLVLGRVARAICRRLAGKNCKVILGDTSLDRGNASDSGLDQIEMVLLPAPQGVAHDHVLASQEHFDLVIAGEPVGYCDIGEYADKLRPFIKRREDEDEREKDQVQWVCIELQERCEDARDDLYAGGYYNVDHVKFLETFRSAARKFQHDVFLLSLPSYEKERRKKREQEKASERLVKREKDIQQQQQQEDEFEQRRGVLYETLFDPLLTAPEICSLPVAFELGREACDADLIFFWLHANDEEPEMYRDLFQSLITSLGGNVRVVVPTLPEGRSQWFSWSDRVAINMGMEWFETADNPTREAFEEAKKEAVKTASFNKPSLEELQCVEDIEVCCKQLLNLAEEEILGGVRPEVAIAFGGFSQGGSVACYTALSGLAPDSLKPHIRGVIPCCSGVPVFHFLGAKMQTQALKSRAAEIYTQPIQVRMVYSHEDPELNDNYISTMRGLCKRFDFPTTLTRLRGSSDDCSRFPEELRQEVLCKALGSLLPAP